MGKKFLFLLDYLPPLVSANGICVDRIMREIRKNFKCFSVSFSNESEIVDEENFFIPLRPWDRIVKVSQKLRNNNHLLYCLFRVLIVIKKCLMMPFWPVFSFSTVYKFYKKSAFLVQKKNVTHVIAVSYPGESLFALVLLKIRFRKKIKTIMYPLDVSLGGKFNGSAIEKRFSVVSSRFLYNFCAFFSDMIIVLENTQDLYKKALSEKVWKKVSLCGIPLAQNFNESKIGLKSVNDLRFVYGGNIDSRVRNPVPLFDFLDNQLKKISCEINVDVYGVVDSVARQELQSRYKYLKINYRGWVDEQTLNTAMLNSSALLSVGNNVGHLIPSKIFKYMSMNRPIIHLCAIKEDPCVPYLEKYGHSLLLYEFEIAFAENLLEWIRDNSSFDVNCSGLFPQCTPEYTATQIVNV
jgi:hypothetical protein